MRAWKVPILRIKFHPKLRFIIILIFNKSQNLFYHSNLVITLAINFRNIYYNLIDILI